MLLPVYEIYTIQSIRWQKFETVWTSRFNLTHVQLPSVVSAILPPFFYNFGTLLPASLYGYDISFVVFFSWQCKTMNLPGAGLPGHKFWGRTCRFYFKYEALRKKVIDIMTMRMYGSFVSYLQGWCRVYDICVRFKERETWWIWLSLCKQLLSS